MLVKCHTFHLERERERERGRERERERESQKKGNFGDENGELW